MPKRLIINADGFGFTRGNNRGILECLQAGAVRSVSVNANFPACDETACLVRDYPAVSVGVHLDLSVGPCVCDPAEVPDLVNNEGEFLGPAFRGKALRGRIPHDQIVRELTAQVQRLVDMGVKLSHWDSHQNQHLYPPFFRAAMEVGNAFGIPCMRTHDHYLFASTGGARRARAMLHLLTHPRRALVYAHSSRMMRRARAAGMRLADRLISPGILDGVQKYQPEFWNALLHRLPEGVSEVYCHPGYPDDTLAANARYVEQRKLELEILRDPSLIDKARKTGVELISFWDIATT